MNRITQQIRTVFRRHGLEPDEMHKNDNTDRYVVSVGAEGTNDQYMKQQSGLNEGLNEEPALDYTEVMKMQGVIDGTEIESGVLNIEGMNADEFLISIE